MPGLLTGYQNYDSISGSTLKGGCGFYFKNNISFVVRQELTKKHSSSQGEYEAHWIEIIHTSKENLVVGVVYRHSKQKDTELFSYLKQTLNLLNFDKNKEVNEFLDVLTSNWFTPQILGPTRFAEHHKPSLVDNIFVNFSDMHCTSGNIIEKITDQLPNFLLIEGLSTQLVSKVKTLKRDLQHFPPKKTYDFLPLNLGEKLEHTKDNNQKYELFHKNLVEVIEQNARH